MANTETFYEVQFRLSPTGDGRTRFFFSSKAAIFEMFTPEQLGVSFNYISNNAITETLPYIGKQCRITKLKFARKRRKPRF